MRLSNRNKVGLYQFFSTLVIATFLGGIIAFFLERYFYNYLEFGAYLFLIIPTFLLILFYVRGRQIFEYDSDGEALNFKNRNVVLFLDRHLSDEFPKYKVISYEVLNFVLFRRLYVKITSKKSNAVILKYDISYLTQKELNDLKFSLSKVLKENRAYKERAKT